MYIDFSFVSDFSDPALLLRRHTTTGPEETHRNATTLRHCVVMDTGSGQEKNC